MQQERILLDIFILFAATQLAGHLARRLRQPAVVGEIVAGVLVGPHLLGWVRGSDALSVLAEIGVVILLFYVGLETRVRDLVRVGRHSLAAGTLGVLLPLGAGIALMLGLGYPSPVACFLGAALVATSVGITARVLVDLHQEGSRAARVILGAAVYDDILGLLILAIVVGAARRELSLLGSVLTAVQAVAFTVFVVLLGTRIVRRFSVHLGSLRVRSPEFVVAMIVCLGLSALAGYLKLAALVGAFLAGMVFSETREAPQIRSRVEPVYDLLVPLFFGAMGALVNVSALSNARVLALAGVVTLVAIVTKLLGCGLGALPLGRREALLIGVGMIPRGEVGIVVAMIGLGLGILSPALYGVVVTMSLVTTLVTPPVLAWLLAGHPVPQRAGAASPVAEGEQGSPL